MSITAVAAGSPTDIAVDAMLAETDSDKRRDLLLAYAADETTSAGRAGAYRYLAGYLLWRLEDERKALEAQR